LKQSWRKFSAFACVFLIFLTVASAKKKKSKSSDTEEPLYTADELQATSIIVPERRDVSYFYGIEPEIIQNVEKGTPDSLRTAITLLKRGKDSMAENESIKNWAMI